MINVLIISSSVLFLLVMVFVIKRMKNRKDCELTEEDYDDNNY